MNKKSINQKIKVIAMVITLALGFSACKDEDPPKPNTPPANSTELITTIKLIFTDSATNAVTTAIFRDLDGDGGVAPSQFDTIKLAANKTYTAQILLLDESKNPVDTVSNEVKKEADEHLFVFGNSNAALNIKITDKDVNNLPLGLSSLWRTSSAFNGTVTVTLRHQSGAGVKNGTAAPGETDVEVAFPIKVK